MDILKQLNDAIGYIENNLCTETDLDEAARIACISKDSFMRFFSYMTDMTVNEYIRRRRLTLAAYELQSTDQRVIDVAVKYGYNSADAFAKAFSKQHGITPTEARDRFSALKVYSPASFHITIKGAKEMNFRIIEMQETEVYGITRFFNCKASARFEQEGIMWTEDCNCVPAEICTGYNGVWYGIWNSGEYTIARDKKYTENDHLKKQIIPAGMYAAFTTEKGVYAGDALPKLHDLIFNSWLPDSKYKQTGDLEIEVYHLWTDKSERREKRYFEILVPIGLK